MDNFTARRERLRRAAEDGERLYRKRMHDEPTIRDDNRIDGILTLDLTDALGLVDELLSERPRACRVTLLGVSGRRCLSLCFRGAHS